MPIISRIGAAAARGFGLFGKIAAIKDAYFNYVTLLLPGNGTNGAQNNTFLDSSSNAFTITRNGNTTQGNFSPFSQTGWGMYQPDINSDYPSFTTSVGTAFQFPGDFTIEGWVYPVAYGSTGDTSLWVTYNGSTYFALNYDGSGNYNIYLNNGTPTSTFSSGIATNQWYHVAMVRSGSTVTLYTNGTARGTITNSSTLGYSSPSLARIGGGAASTTRYVSNFRIVKGTAVYTGNFTPPTTPLTAITNTQLLTCQSNRFVDNSTNNFTPTFTGSPSIQAFSPFAPTAAWSASTNGGSGYYDGSGDYLSVAAQTALGMGAGDFTYEAWVYVNEVVPTNAIRGLFDGRVGGATGCGIYTSADTGTTSKLVYTTNSAIVASSTNTIKSYSWTHVAVTRSGTTVRGFLNGALEFTYTDSRTFSSSAGTYIGADVSINCFNGYINDARILKGTALYTAAFTPPTAPLTAISGTSLLLSATNGGITDATAKNDLETVGNAQISTTQSKFGGSSMYFDGTGDRLTIPFTNDFLELGIGGQNFTVEAWIYPTNTMASTGQILSKGGGTASWSTTSGAQYQWAVSSSALSWSFNSSGSAITVNSGTVTLNAWQHVAVSYDGTTTRTFLNGVLQATSTSSYTAPTTRNLQYIGMTQSGGFTQEFYGYIDDLRITKGIARYTSNFTPPTSAFLLQ